ncbi:MAG: hypothetical protein LUD76_04925 [Alistipes sp.]|nr:hypothetical protein [Alistipes sp.]
MDILVFRGTGIVSALLAGADTGRCSRRAFPWISFAGTVRMTARNPSRFGDTGLRRLI